MSSGENDTHVRMETTATMVDDGDYSNNESNVSPSSSKRKEEPVVVSPISPTVVDTIPPSLPHRTLVVCFDGTGDQFDEDCSNVVEFVGLLKKDDLSKQMVYYQPGIGTYTSPRYSHSRMASKISELMDEAFAWNLKAHIMGGYKFLMQNYRVSDKICIFGFSRGSYTAQCLAGMLQKVGLLPAFNDQQIPFVYEMYKSADMDGRSTEFKSKIGNDVKIEFIGLWDTVNSVGLTPRYMPFTLSNTAVKIFRHAVSLDEHRAKFKPVHWHAPNQNHPKTSKTPTGEFPKTNYEGIFAEHLEDEKGVEGKERGTDIDEVWFAGCHCDVGGGSVKNSVRTSLARIPLRWMIRECFKADTGILFRLERLKTVNLDPNTLYPKVLPRPEALPLTTLPPEEMHIKTMNPQDRVTKPRSFTGFFTLFKKSPSLEVIKAANAGNADDYKGPFDSEELADLKDSLAPIYDELVLDRFWWIAEYIPFRQRYEEVDTKLSLRPVKRKMNKGRGRKIPTYKGNEADLVRVHRSVKTRMDARFLDGGKYSPKVVNFDEKRVEWVD